MTGQALDLDDLAANLEAHVASGQQLTRLGPTV
jgi:hypothetical protein